MTEPAGATSRSRETALREGPGRLNVATGVATAPRRLQFGRAFFALRTFDSLRDPQFRWFYVAMLGQMAAMNMQMLVRGYLVYDLTGSYAALGSIGLATGAPMLTLSVVGGIIADRMPKKTTLQAGQAASMLIAAGIALLLVFGQLNFAWLFVASLAQGTVLALMMPARQAFIPEVVGMDRLMNAVSLSAAGMNLMRLLAPAAGGFMIAIIGPAWVYWLMAGLYGIALLALIPLTSRPPATRSDDGAPKGRGARGLSDLVEGARYVVHDRRIFMLLLLSFVTSMLAMPYIQMLPGFVADVFDDESGSLLGVLIASSGAGALLGALGIASLPERRRGLLLLVSALVIGVGLILFSSSHLYWLSMIFMAVVGLGTAGRQALGNVLLQAYVEDVYRGRVMSIYMTQFSLMMFGTFFVGIISEFIGVDVALGGLGALLIVVTLGFLAFAPRLRTLS